MYCRIIYTRTHNRCGANRLNCGAECSSSLPKDSCLFQRDGNIIELGQQPRREIGRRTCCGHGHAENVSAGFIRQWVQTGHFLPRGRTAIDAIGIKFHPHRLGIDTLTSMMCFPSRVATLTEPKFNPGHFWSMLCRQSTICFPIAPWLAVRDWQVIVAGR